MGKTATPLTATTRNQLDECNPNDDPARQGNWIPWLTRNQRKRHKESPFSSINASTTTTEDLPQSEVGASIRSLMTYGNEDAMDRRPGSEPREFSSKTKAIIRFTFVLCFSCASCVNIYSRWILVFEKMCVNRIIINFGKTDQKPKIELANTLQKHEIPYSFVSFILYSLRKFKRL